jgi:hypothetical protein
MGLSAVSQASSVPADSVLAVVATILTALAGQDAVIQGPLGPTRLSKVDLLTNSGDFRMQQLIDQLVFPLEGIQRRLVQNMGRNSPDAMELLACGAYSSPATGKIANQEIRDKSLKRQMDALLKSPTLDTASALHQDLTFDPVPYNVESMLHPNFLLKGSEGRSLKLLVDDCHQRTALVLKPKLELEREGSEPAKVMKILSDLMDGEVITKRPAPIERGRDSSLLAKAQALLSLTTGEIEALAAMGADWLNRFLWLKLEDRRESKPACKDACAAFMEVYRQALHEILAHRREGQPLMLDFESDETVRLFDSEGEIYENELCGNTSQAAPWARGLPQALFWAMAFLRRSMPSELGPSQGSLVITSFAVARRLVENHNDQVLAITNASLLTARHRLAKRIVDEMETAKSPQTFRDIARYTHIQKKEVVAPVVDALIEVGVLVRDENGVHTRGPVDLVDVMEILDRKFVQD